MLKTTGTFGGYKGNKRRFSLAARLILYFSLFSLVPLSINSLLSISISRKALENSCNQHLNTLGAEFCKKIGAFMNNRYQDIRLLSLLPVLVTGNYQEIQSFIDTIIESHPFYEAITFIDNKGRIAACTNKKLIGASRLDRSWFQQAINANPGEIIPLEVYRAETAEWKLVIGFNSPVLNNAGEAVGVLSTRINLDYITDRLATISEPTGSMEETFLIGREKQILAGPDEKDILKPYPVASYSAIEQLLAEKSGIVKYVNDRGEPVITAYHAVHKEGHFDGWGWGLIITVLQKDVFSSIYYNTRLSILLFVTIALATLLAARFTANCILKPVSDIANKAEIISREGPAQKHIEYNRNDEIGDLISLLNKMIDNLQRTMISRDNLSREIEEREQAEIKLMRSHEQLQNLSAHLQSIREEERTNIAREIHDELGQSLTALKIDLFWLHKRLPENNSVLLEKSETMLNLINTIILTVQRISEKLRPGLLDDLCLAAAIEWQAEEFQKRTGIECKTTIDPEDLNMEREPATAVFRIFQETLTNVSRHAKATEVRVVLKEDPEKLLLTVEDNGKGITKKQISDSKAYGLIGMRERSLFCGGEVKISGLHGKGTKVTLTIPHPGNGVSDA
jgi:signal transduction histidine kinase